MKNKFSILLSSFLLLLFSCKKEETRDYYEGGTAPALKASATTVTLEPGQEANTALVLNWSNPEYQFTTGPSSHDVSYTIEFDTLGGNFSSNIKKIDDAGSNLSKTYTVAELNGILGNDMQLQLNPRRNYTIQARVVSSIPVSGGGKFFQLASNVISFTTKPFAPPPKVTLPFTGELYLVGDATPGDWGNPVPLPDQAFTKLSNTLYQIVVPLKAGKHFLFIPDNGKWDNKYACHDGGTQPHDGGDFGYNGGNSYYNADMPAPDLDGTYKITVDFQLGKYSIVKQ
jgi:hypothetical protein